MNEFNPKNYVDTEAAWLAFRSRWLRHNPPLDNGYYLCGICGNWVASEEVTLDHIEPRTAENKFLASNIQPAHWHCNTRKGSQRLKPVVATEVHEFLRMLSEL